MFMKSALASASLFALMISAANAGEPIVAPIVELEPIIGHPVDPAADWTGGYVGGWIGYAFGADDEVGLEIFENGQSQGNRNDLTNLDVSGLNGGVNVGYRWQRGSWVFGPELTVESGDIIDEQHVDQAIADVAPNASFKSEVNYIAGLQMKAGYIVTPKTLVYGSAGFVHGEFDYTFAPGNAGSTTQGYTADGYSLGAGVERRLNARWSMFAEWQYRNFGKTDVTFANGTDELVTRATPEHHNLKLGVNFAF